MEQMQSTGPGRPRAFDIDKALAAGIDMFRQRGFESTSLDALTTAMGISRSSFYAAFGSKHGVLIAALTRYSQQRLATLEAIGASAPEKAAETMLRALVGSGGEAQGCLMVNCISELCPHDPEVATLSRHHLDRVEHLFARALCPDQPDRAMGQARALVALGLGIHALRKVGRGPEDVTAIFDEIPGLLAAPA